MRTRLPLLFVAAVAVAALLAAPTVASAQIEKPDRGKKYPIGPQNGPWMIMVASFSAPPPDLKTEGMSPEQAADELVFELRSHKIPAYTYSLDGKVEKIETIDRLNEPDTRIYAAQRGSVCVLAGNYRTIDPVTKHADAKIAKDTLDWIKKFRPKFLSGGEADAAGLVHLNNGGNFRVTKSQPGPLAGAFFTTNPLKSAEEIKAQNPERLSLLAKLNGGGDDCSLYNNKGKYTLVIASFYGKSKTLNGKATEVEKFERNFDQSIASGRDLNHAGEDAWHLAKYMRQLKFDAYVWHDEYKSVVTVGTFETTDDPRIPTAMATYAAKTKTDAQKKSPVLVAEFLTVPLKPTAQDPVRKKWIFDPQPRLMAVPKQR